MIWLHLELGKHAHLDLKRFMHSYIRTMTISWGSTCQIMEAYLLVKKWGKKLRKKRIIRNKQQCYSPVIESYYLYQSVTWRSLQRMLIPSASIMSAHGSEKNYISSVKGEFCKPYKFSFKKSPKNKKGQRKKTFDGLFLFANICLSNTKLMTKLYKNQLHQTFYYLAFIF